ncbi:hypothetical protein O9G_003321 [Rozella allomycis CSF55]|uniref:Uncharacterized protein n=1 Tax=Rozella allomycis (strain CSF55) TaxID=988480 RepID=A0A075B245_ROZAC|nr:hypothetical protein O9G_003321 [Rozella allomycis CSF55]|eukprot:EPZ36450.1 hypothetical protein O9G_003321 [Rozella allomycis CSF55]
MNWLLTYLTTSAYIVSLNTHPIPDGGIGPQYPQYPPTGAPSFGPAAPPGPSSAPNVNGVAPTGSNIHTASAANAGGGTHAATSGGSTSAAAAGAKKPPGIAANVGATVLTTLGTGMFVNYMAKQGQERAEQYDKQNRMASTSQREEMSNIEQAKTAGLLFTPASKDDYAFRDQLIALRDNSIDPNSAHFQRQQIGQIYDQSIGTNMNFQVPSIKSLLDAEAQNQALAGSANLQGYESQYFQQPPIPGNQMMQNMNQYAEAPEPEYMSVNTNAHSVYDTQQMPLPEANELAGTGPNANQQLKRIKINRPFFLSIMNLNT